MKQKFISSTIIYFMAAPLLFFGRLATFFALISAISANASVGCIGALAAISEQDMIAKPWLFSEVIKSRLNADPKISLIDVPAPEMLPQILFMIEALKKQKKTPNSHYTFQKNQSLAALLEAAKNPKLGYATLAILNGLAALTPVPPKNYYNPEKPEFFTILKHADRDKFTLVLKGQRRIPEPRHIISSEYPIFFSQNFLNPWEISKTMDFYAMTGIATSKIGGKLEISWVFVDGVWLSPFGFALHDLAHAGIRINNGAILSISKRADFWQSLEAQLLVASKDVQDIIIDLIYTNTHESQIDFARPYMTSHLLQSADMNNKSSAYAEAVRIIVSTIQKVTVAAAP